MLTGIILCGGLGTRLRGVLSDRPKCLAPVLDKTYLDYLTDYLSKKGISNFIFATGHGHDQIDTWLHSTKRNWIGRLSKESSPMGTGGALRLAAELVDSSSFIAVNGDTFLEFDCDAMLRRHQCAARSVTLAAVHVHDASAFGCLDIQDGIVCAFNEKGISGPGYINAGAYIINKQSFMQTELKPFSFEKDYLQDTELRPAAFISTGVFLDIGTPSTLLQADRVANLISQST
jgi:D-glycero-alpha-D-manno-heptose 1-phosphate guanylyltransferase